MKDKVIKRNTRGKKISKWKETINKKNSKLRVRVEHAFGFMEKCLHGMSKCVVYFVYNTAFNTLTNLVYNLCRYEQVMRLRMNQTKQQIDNQQHTVHILLKSKKIKNQTELKEYYVNLPRHIFRLCSTDLAWSVDVARKS